MPILGRGGAADDYMKRGGLLGIATQYSPHLAEAGRRLLPQAQMATDYVGPAADVKDMRNYSAATMDELRQGNYGPALANLGMTGAALAMTALPGSVGAVDDAVKGVAKKVDDLPMDTASRMKRAEEMGFDTDVFHGTASDVKGFAKERLGAVTKARGAKNAVWLSDSPKTASGYAEHAETEQITKLIDASQAAERRGDWDAAHDLMVKAEALESAGGNGGANVIPAKIRGNLMEFDADGATLMDLDDGQLGDLVQEALDGGYDGLKISNFSDEAAWGNYNPTTHYAIFDPKNIRSRHAKFDPAKKDSADLLASIGGAGLLGLGLTQRQDEN